MHASIKCDRTTVSRELFARHCNYVLLNCHLVSVQGLCIAALDSMHICSSATYSSLPAKKCDQRIVLCCFSGSGSGTEPARSRWPRDFKCFPHNFCCVSVHLAAPNTPITRPISPQPDELVCDGRATYFSLKRPTPPPGGVGATCNCNFDGYRPNT